MKKFSIKFYYALVILLFYLGGFLMFYRLGNIPNEIHVDEAGAFYDAMSLMRYGVDRFLYHNPVYFINFGGGQNALYTYLASFSFKLFGSSLWSYRLVSVVVCLFSYYCYFKLVRLYKSRLFSVLLLFLLIIMPVYIMKARWGLESFLLNPMLIISIYFYVKAIRGENHFSFFIAGFLFGISFYTYAISYLIIPLFLVISAIYLLVYKKVKIIDLFILFIPVICFGIPLLLMLLINKGIIHNEIILNFISIPKMWFYRGSEISIFNVKYFIDDLKVLLFGNNLVYNSIPKFGCLYNISILFIIFGLIILIYKIVYKKYDLLDIFMFILFLVVFGVCLCVFDLNVNKGNAIYISLVYFIVLFMEWLYINRNKFLLCILLGLYCISFFGFSNYYFNDYSNDYSNMVLFEDYSLFEAMEYAESIYDNNERIYLRVLEGYIYYLLYHDIDPYTFNESAVISKEMGRVISCDDYKFSLIDMNDFYNHNAVYIMDYQDDFVNSFINRGFSYKIFGNYYVLYFE